MSIQNAETSNTMPPIIPFMERIRLAKKEAGEIGGGRKAQRKEIRHSGSDSVPSLMDSWSRACVRFFPNEVAIPLTQKDGFILHAEMKRCRETGNTVPFVPFMEWCVERWRLIIAERFSRLRDKPPYPVIRFFVKCIGTFLLAHSEKGRLEKRANMTTRELMIDILMRKGRSQEAAEREVDERLGLAAVKGEIEAERRKLQMLQKRQEQTKEIEERLAMMERHVIRKEARAVRGVAGTFEQWT